MTNMSINSINNQTQGIWSMRQNQDNYEKNIQGQIVGLEEKMESLSTDQAKTTEQKKIEKQEIQEQIQTLKSQLQQYRIQKQHREETKRQTAANRATEQTASSDKVEKKSIGLSDTEMGVILSLSGTKEQIAGMKKIRTNLEGKLRTAESEEVKQSLQEKIDNLNEVIGSKIQGSRETIQESIRESGRNENGDADSSEEEPDNTSEKEEQSENKE